MSGLSADVKTDIQQSETAFRNVMHELIKQELNGPVPLSLLEYTGNLMDLDLVLNMTDDEITEMIEEADRDGDGEISEDEFMRIMRKTNLF